MKQLRKPWIALAIAAAVLALAAYVTRPREPVYKGRRLSEWLACFDSTTDKQKLREARNAVSTIGSDGIPVLLDCVRSRDSKPGMRLKQFVNSQSLIPWRIPTAAQLQERGVIGFRIIGWKGWSATDDLAKLLDEDQCAMSATLCLAQIGPAAVPGLVVALENRNDRIKELAAGLLARYPGAAEPAVPSLIRCFRSPAPAVRLASVQAVAKIRHDPANSIFALTPMLRDPDRRVREATASALGGFGGRARPATPALIAELHQAGGIWQQQLHLALSKIDPEAEGQLVRKVMSLPEPWEPVEPGPDTLRNANR